MVQTFLGRFEELGSGVRNIFKYTKLYSNGKQPLLTEGDVFKLVIPIDEIQYGANDGANDGVNDGVIDGVRIEIIKITDIIKSNKGINTLDIAARIGKSKPFIERYLRIAREVRIIEFKGAPKTGGYYLTEKMKAKLK